MKNNTHKTFDLAKNDADDTSPHTLTSIIGPIFGDSRHSSVGSRKSKHTQRGVLDSILQTPRPAQLAGQKNLQ